jgi:ankyrin repeat protein
VEFPKNTLHCVASYDGIHNHLMDAQTRIEITQFLLDHGADPNDLPKGSFHTPLISAAASHDLELVKFLLAHGADPNRANEQNYTPIISAANSCSYPLPTSSANDIAALEARQQTQLAVIESLIRSGAYIPSQLNIEPFSKCCSGDRKTNTQNRICQIFGKNNS